MIPRDMVMASMVTGFGHFGRAYCIVSMVGANCAAMILNEVSTQHVKRRVA